MQHTKYYSSASYNRAAHEDGSCAAHEIELMCSIRKITLMSHASSVRVTRPKYKNTRVLLHASVNLEMSCTVIMEAKSQRFSEHFHKSYQTVKLFSCLTFVVYGIFCGETIKMQFLKIDIFEVVIVTSSRNYTSLHYHSLHICDWLWENPPLTHKDDYLEKRN